MSIHKICSIQTKYGSDGNGQWLHLSERDDTYRSEAFKVARVFGNAPARIENTVDYFLPREEWIAIKRHRSGRTIFNRNCFHYLGLQRWEEKTSGTSCGICAHQSSPDTRLLMNLYSGTFMLTQALLNLFTGRWSSLLSLPICPRPGGMEALSGRTGIRQTKSSSII